MSSTSAITLRISPSILKKLDERAKELGFKNKQKLIEFILLNYIIQEK